MKLCAGQAAGAAWILSSVQTWVQPTDTGGTPGKERQHQDEDRNLANHLPLSKATTYGNRSHLTTPARRVFYVRAQRLEVPWS